MKTYTASQELVDIMLRNGYKEKTKTFYPEHYKRLLNTEYENGNVKRKFAIKGLQDSITFDYINVIGFISNAGHGSRTKLTSDEVKSMVAFYKMPQSFIDSWRDDIFNLYKEYYSAKQNADEFLTAKEKKLIKVFESVNLN